MKELVKELALLTVQTLTGMTTDVYPRENCIAPAMVFIVWTTDTTNGRGLAPDMRPHVVAIPPQKREASHTGGTQEGCVWAGTVA